MRRKALVVLAVALAFTSAASAGTRPAHRLTGAIRNLTCPGPCLRRPNPPLYTGAGLTVKAHRVRDGRLVAVRRPSDGRFGMRVRRGRYRVSADVAGLCWQGSHRRVRVRHREVHVRLTVRNTCIR
jgi:hypothetical protein